MTKYYDYDAVADREVLEALIKVWDPPKIAQPTWQGVGNCISASRFAGEVLRNLNVHCEMTVCRLKGNGPDKRYGTSVGWGDCGSYAVSSDGMLGGHAVTVGHGWLFDASAAQFGVAGPVIAQRMKDHSYKVHDDRHNFPCTCEWAYDADGWSFQYTWAPGMIEGIYTGADDGTKAAAKRLATEVRQIVGPRRKPRAYEWM